MADGAASDAAPVTIALTPRGAAHAKCCRSKAKITFLHDALRCPCNKAPANDPYRYDLVCGNMELGVAGQRLYSRFDVTQDGFTLQFEGDWLGTVSVVLVKIEYSRYDEQTRRPITKEIAQEIYSWTGQPTDAHSAVVRSGMSPAVKEILETMKGGVAFLFSVSTTISPQGSSSGGRSGLIPVVVERSIQLAAVQLGLRELYCPISLVARCACHCAISKRKLAFRHETCQVCPPVTDERGKVIKYAVRRCRCGPALTTQCHVLVGGAACTFGGHVFDVHITSHDDQLNVRLAGETIKEPRFLSIALLRTEASRTVAPRPLNMVQVHNLELFRIPTDLDSTQPSILPPKGCVAALDADLLIGSALSHFLVTSFLPGQ